MLYFNKKKFLIIVVLLLFISIKIQLWPLKNKGIAPISSLQRQPKVKILSLLWRGGEQRGVKQEFEAVSGSIFSSSLYFLKYIKIYFKRYKSRSLTINIQFKRAELCPFHRKLWTIVYRVSLNRRSFFSSFTLKNCFFKIKNFLKLLKLNKSTIISAFLLLSLNF